MRRLSKFLIITALAILLTACGTEAVAEDDLSADYIEEEVLSTEEIIESRVSESKVNIMTEEILRNIEENQEAYEQSLLVEEQQEQEEEPVVENSVTISSDDATRLEKIAYAEARGEGVEGMALVMLVILNRVDSTSFPNTIDGVITQSGQFTPVSSGSYASATPNDSTHEALELVLSGWDESCGALYFESCSGSSWHSQHLTYLFQHGNMRFYK